MDAWLDRMNAALPDWARELLTFIMPALTIALHILLLVVPLLLLVAMLIYAERKVIAMAQLRRGPNVTGPFGLLQSFADALKLLLKENLIPTTADKGVFLIAPIITFTLALSGWAVIPLSQKLVVANVNVGVLYLFAVSSLGVYGIIMAGWASNSTYAFLGAIRSAAQMVSYEVSIGLVIITVLLVAGTLNLSEIVLAQAGHWYIFSGLFPMAVVFFISGLAETNRLPFDLPEAEGELVAGYNVEYSAMAFALFFLGEYASMILISGMTTILFLGGWLPPFAWSGFEIIPGAVWFIAKVFFLLFVFLWVRATFPRYRYDQLMRLGWKIFLPLSLLWVVLTAGWLEYSGILFPPTEACAMKQETIGQATMDKSGVIQMRLRATDTGSGSIGEAMMTVKPGDTKYEETKRHLDGILPGETKPVPSYDADDCKGGAK